MSPPPPPPPDRALAGKGKGQLFAELYLALALCLAGVGAWNSSRLHARYDMLDEPGRDWAQAAIDTLADDAARSRLASIQKALSMDFAASPIALAAPPPNSLASPGGAPAPATPSARVVAAPPPAEPILRVAFVGDSLANGYAAGAARALAESKSKARAVDEGRISTGLVARAYFDWPAKIEQLCQSHPGAMALSFGSNDGMDMREGAAFMRLGSAEWAREYGRRAEQAILAARACGAKAVWITLPPMRDAEPRRKAAIVAAAQERACSMADACVRPFADLGGELAERFSERAAIGGKSKLLRAEDGVHMGPEGYYLVARRVVAALGLARVGDGGLGRAEPPSSP